MILRGTCFCFVEDGIGYDASTLASLNAFPLRIISAQPYTKIAIFHPLQSNRLSGFVFMVLVWACTRLNTIKTKQMTFLSHLLCNKWGGRWYFYTISKNLSTSIYRPFCPLFLPIWSHIGLCKMMPYICKGSGFILDLQRYPDL